MHILYIHAYICIYYIYIYAYIIYICIYYIYIHILYIYGAPILDVSRSHTTTHHADSDGVVNIINPLKPFKATHIYIYIYMHICMQTVMVLSTSLTL